MTRTTLAALFGLSLFLVFSFSALKFGKPVEALRENWFRESLYGADACMARVSSAMLETDERVLICTKKHQRRLNITNLDGRGRLSAESGAQQTFDGMLSNPIDNAIVTWIRIKIESYDSDGTAIDYYANTDVWILPGNRARFSANIERNINELPLLDPGCDYDLDESELKNCWVWNIDEVKGLAF